MLNSATRYGVAVGVAIAVALTSHALAAQRPQAIRPDPDTLRVETLRYFRDSVKASIALETEPSPATGVDTQAGLADALGVPRLDRARMLRCTDACPDAPVYLLRVSAPEWSGDTARVSIAWLWRQRQAGGRSLVAEGGDEFLLTLRNGAWKVVGIGRRYRVSRKNRSS